MVTTASPRREETESATRLGVLRLPLMVCVVYIHAYRPGECGSGQGGWAALLDFLLSENLVLLARPLFFLMAGYFFFSGGDLSWPVCRRKWKTRVSTLLVPYVFWNLLVLSLWAFGQWWSVTAGHLPSTGNRVAEFGVWDYANAIFGMTGYPIAYQLWFIRDLMVIMLFAPLFRIAITQAPNLFSLVLLVVWMTGTWPLGIPMDEGVVFFHVGARLAVSRGGFALIDRFAGLLVAVYAGFLVSAVLFRGAMSSLPMRNSGLLLGVLAVLCLTRVVITNDRVKGLFLHPGGLSFFLFAAHEPLLTMVKKGAYSALGEASQGAVLLSRLAITALVTVICSAAYRALASFAPGALRVLVGRR